MKASALENYMKVAQYEYDFAKHGGAIGAITIDPKLLPAGAKVLAGMIDITTTFVGATATIAFSLVGAGDVKTATAVASFAADALLDVVPAWTAATAIKVAANSSLTMTVAVAALTAGKCTINLFYIVTE
ncbi:MAG: hypothetical protein A2V65_01280 [Deltaproteobacteria bacterium RBG_13_49_15]|nr:MAG: hypothetical protein A2V65_01280 [Deltaproteobacteria bacterium RBG_13_49_15]